MSGQDSYREGVKRRDVIFHVNDVLVKRLNTSWRTVRSRALVGDAVGSPTPNPVQELKKLL